MIITMSFTPFAPKIGAGWRDLLSKLNLLGEYNKLVNRAIENYEPQENRFLRDIDEFEEAKLKRLEEIANAKEKPIYFEIVDGMLPKINDKLDDVSLLKDLITAYSDDLFSVEKSSNEIIAKLSKLAVDYPPSSIPFHYSTRKNTWDIVGGIEKLKKEKTIDINQIEISLIWNDDISKSFAIELKMYIELKNSFILKPNVADKTTIYYSNKKGLFRTENGLDFIYPIGSGTKRANMLEMLLKKDCSGEELRIANDYKVVANVSKEIEEINNQFKKRLSLTEKIITNSPRTGYTINTDAYDVQVI